jgi:hypothetical protein
VASALRPSEALSKIRGALLESAVVSSLYPVVDDLHGFMSYWRESSVGREVDIVFESSNGLIPIEVKSGDNKSGLAQFREKFSSSINTAYLLKDDDHWDYREEGKSPCVVMPVSYFLYFLNSTNLMKCEQEWSTKTQFSFGTPVMELALPESLKHIQTFRNQKRKQFIDTIQGAPFYRIAAGPQQSTNATWNVSRATEELAPLLQDPPKIREFDNAWHPGVGHRATPQGFTEGLKAEIFLGPERYKRLYFYFNGALEFFVPINGFFLLHEQHQHNWLNPYPLIEYTVNFLRLFKKISSILEIKDPFWFELQLENVRGLELHPGHPLSMAYMMHAPDSDQYAIKEESIFVNGTIPYLNPYKEDIEAYEILKLLYFKLGLREEALPFFDKDGTCRMK